MQTHAHSVGGSYQCTHSVSSTLLLGLARTIYIWCIYGIFGRELTKYTVIYGVYIQFWPTLYVTHMVLQPHITDRLDLELEVGPLALGDQAGARGGSSSPSNKVSQSSKRGHSHLDDQAGTRGGRSSPPNKVVNTPMPPKVRIRALSGGADGGRERCKEHRQV
jgi:hypothetical protein